MRLFKYFIFLFLFLLFQPVARAADITVSVDVYQYNLKDKYFGINLNEIKRIKFSDKSYTDYIKSFNASTLRYPPAEAANYWDWKNGNTFKQLKNIPKDLKKYSLNPFYLKDLKKIISVTNTEAIFVVNILTSDLNYQLEMLKQANNIGIPIRNVEIGIDCYINSPTNLKRFPSIQSYLKEAAIWKSTIEKEFIKANVTVIGALSQEDTSSNRRRNVWNSIISPQLSANAVMTLRVLGGPGLFQDSYYVNETEFGTTILNRPKLNTIDSSTVLSNAFRITNQTLEAISNLPSDKQINISEYNMYDKYNFLNGKWIQGLYAGIMTLNFLNEERINKIIYTPSPSINKNSTQSVSELAVQMITSSMSGKSNYQRLIINNNPIITDSRNNEAYFSLMGYAFSNNNRKEIILLNLSSKNMNINTSMLLKNTSSLYIQYFGNPLSDKIGANGISKNKGACHSTLSLPAYSITKIY